MLSTSTKPHDASRNLILTGGRYRFGTSDGLKAAGGLELNVLGFALGVPALAFFVRAAHLRAPEHLFGTPEDSSQ